MERVNKVAKPSLSIVVRDDMDVAHSAAGEPSFLDVEHWIRCNFADSGSRVARYSFEVKSYSSYNNVVAIDIEFVDVPPEQMVANFLANHPG